MGWLEKGMIVEIGNHEQLMERKGVYYSLVKSQNDCVINETQIWKEIQTRMKDMYLYD